MCARFMAIATIALCSACIHVQDTRPLVEWDQPSPIILFRDVRVFTATSTEALEHHDVEVRAGRIVAVRPTGEAVPAGARIFEGEGRTLLPGLVDAHAHTQVTGAPPWYVVLPQPEHVLQEALYAGTTTIHDMGGPTEDVVKLRAQRPHTPKPRMLVSGMMLTAKGGYPGSYIRRVLPEWLTGVMLTRYAREVNGDEVEAVDAIAKTGVDFVKIMVAETPDGTPTLSAQQIARITSAAKRHGLRVVAHIDTAENAVRSTTNGVHGLVHGVHSTPLTEDQAQLIAATGAVIAPTLITFERLYQLDNDSLKLSKMEQETVAPNLQRALTEGRASGFKLNQDLDKWLDYLTHHRDARLGTNVTKLRDAGAKILVGTDGHGSTASFPAGIHEEMRLLAQAGVPNAEILLGATAWSARLTTDRPSFGSIEPGKAADLLLVDGNPLEDISATEKIVAVVRAGRVVKRKAPDAESPRRF